MFGHSWSWYLVIGGAYTVLVFFLALGSIFKDSDDLFGSSELIKYLPTMLLLHAFPLVVLLSGVFLWFQLKRDLPEWATHDGSRGLTLVSAWLPCDGLRQRGRRRLDGGEGQAAIRFARG